jgi:hypothetical protein
VKPTTMIIAPDGSWMSPDGPEFLARLGDPDPDYDATGFAVRNLGFIKVEMYQHASIEIELHPRNVELPALLAVQQQLQSAPAKLFRIRFLDTEWRSEISSSPEHTISRLSQLCAPVFIPKLSERFSIEPRDLSVLFEEQDNPLRPLAQKWRTSFGRFDPTVISLAVEHQLLSRLMIAGIAPQRSEPIWRFIGDGHKWIGRQYQLYGVGEKVEHMPDKDYGQWATQYYTSVAHAGEPRYDLITGMIQYEDEDGKPRRAHRYERLMLPWKTPSNEVFVTMCSRPAGTDISSTSAGSITEPVSKKSLRSV